MTDGYEDHSKNDKMKIRPQYHLRKSSQGLLAWDVRHLISKTSGIVPIDVPLSNIRELDETFWFSGEGETPTCRRIAEHAKMIDETSLDYPIILDPDGRVMDGMHRVCKALNLGLNSIPAYQLTELPEPDFIGISPDDLPYESDP